MLAVCPKPGRFILWIKTTQKRLFRYLRNSQRYLVQIYLLSSKTLPIINKYTIVRVHELSFSNWRKTKITDYTLHCVCLSSLVTDQQQGYQISYRHRTLKGKQATGELLFFWKYLHWRSINPTFGSPTSHESGGVHEVLLLVILGLIPIHVAFEPTEQMQRRSTVIFTAASTTGATFLEIFSPPFQASSVIPRFSVGSSALLVPL